MVLDFINTYLNIFKYLFSTEKDKLYFYKDEDVFLYSLLMIRFSIFVSLTFSIGAALCVSDHYFLLKHIKYFIYYYFITSAVYMLIFYIKIKQYNSVIKQEIYDYAEEVNNKLTELANLVDYNCDICLIESKQNYIKFIKDTKKSIEEYKYKSKDTFELKLLQNKIQYKLDTFYRDLEEKKQLCMARNNAKEYYYKYESLICNFLQLRYSKLDKQSIIIEFKDRWENDLNLVKDRTSLYYIFIKDDIKEEIKHLNQLIVQKKELLEIFDKYIDLLKQYGLYNAKERERNEYVNLLENFNSYYDFDYLLIKSKLEYSINNIRCFHNSESKKEKFSYYNYSNSLLEKYFKVLELEPTANAKEIKKKYREMIHKYHPDNRKTGNEEKSKQINVAYDELCKYINC